MAVFQLGFHAFGQLEITPAARAAGSAGDGRATPGVLMPGDCFRTLPGQAAATTIRIGHDGPGHVSGISGLPARIAPGSPFGTVGAAVDLGERIDVETTEAVPRALAFDVLCIGGVATGLVGPEPLVAGVGYAVRRLTARSSDTAPPAGDAKGAPPQDSFRRNSAAAGAVLCLTHGTLIDTPQGPRLIEDLAPGDLVTTLVNGSQPVRWVGSGALGRSAGQDRSQLWPILVEAGALGNPRPLLVSPRHRLLISDWRAQVYFGEEQVLIAASALENGQSIRRTPPLQGMVYCHLLFDRHEVILTEGVLSESFHPGEEGLSRLDADDRHKIALLFPHMPVGRRRAAFPIVKPAEARALRLPG